MSDFGRPFPLGVNPFPSTGFAGLDRLIYNATASGFGRPERFPDGTYLCHLGQNATHFWDVVLQPTPAGLPAVYMIVTDASGDDVKERYIPIRGDDDVPTYIGHY